MSGFGCWVSGTDVISARKPQLSCVERLQVLAGPVKYAPWHHIRQCRRWHRLLAGAHRQDACATSFNWDFRVQVVSGPGIAALARGMLIANRREDRLMASGSSSRPDFHADVLLYEEDGEWVGHCLQLDLVEAGATRQEAQKNVLDVICAHIEYALSHDNMEHLFHPAPPEVWRQFWKSEVIGSKTIRIHVPDDVFPAHTITVREASAPALAA